MRCVHRTLRLKPRREFGTLSFENFGLPAQVLKLGTPSPSVSHPPSGHINVALKASQVLHEDIRVIKGTSFKQNTTGTAGLTGVGVVTAVGSDVSNFSLNQTVFVSGSGLWTEQAVTVPAGAAVDVKKLPFEEAALLPTATAAWALLNNFAKLSPGDIVLQANSSSAVGKAITEIGTALGLKVVSVSDAELKQSKSVSKIVKEKVPGGGPIKLAISGHSGPADLALVRGLADGGVLVVYSGMVENLAVTEGVYQPVTSAIFHDVSVIGFDFFSWQASDPAGFAAAAARVVELAAAGKVALKTSKVFPQSDYLKALAEVEASGAGVVIKH